METVLVLGATSPTAQVFLDLLERDYPTVTAKLFVCNPQKLTPDQRQRYQVVVGDATNYDDLAAAIVGTHYVYSSVGGLGTGPVTPNLIRAIQDTATPIAHVVDISAGGVYGEYLSGKRPYLSAVRTMYPEYTQYQLKKSDWYRDSGLAYTIFRPGLIQNGPETQLITHTPDYRQIGPDEFDINRTTFARAAANALFNNQYHNQNLSVSNGADL